MRSIDDVKEMAHASPSAEFFLYDLRIAWIVPFHGRSCSKGSAGHFSSHSATARRLRQDAVSVLSVRDNNKIGYTPLDVDVDHTKLAEVQLLLLRHVTSGPPSKRSTLLVLTFDLLSVIWSSNLLQRNEYGRHYLVPSWVVEQRVAAHSGSLLLAPAFLPTSDRDLDHVFAAQPCEDSSCYDDTVASPFTLTQNMAILGGKASHRSEILEKMSF
jgi:hypothetical protein